MIFFIYSTKVNKASSPSIDTKGYQKNIYISVSFMDCKRSCSVRSGQQHITDKADVQMLCSQTSRWRGFLPYHQTQSSRLDRTDVLVFLYGLLHWWCFYSLMLYIYYSRGRWFLSFFFLISQEKGNVGDSVVNLFMSLLKCGYKSTVQRITMFRKL